MAQNPSNVIPDQLIVVEGGKQLVPPPSSGDSGKVLGVLNSNGDIGWTEDREGMAQQQADWAETDPSKVTFIANKPTIPTVDQTYNASSSNAQSGVAVASAIAGVNAVPASTSSDSGKVLKVDAQGAPVWGDAPAGTAEFLWSTVTLADVEGAISDGKSVVITDDTFSGDAVKCYLEDVQTSSLGTTYYFSSQTRPGSLSVSNQNASVRTLTINMNGAKFRDNQAVGLGLVSEDGSVTIADGTISGQLNITTNAVPASTSAEANKVLTVNSSGTPVWADAQGGGGGGGSREYKPKIDDSELVPRSIVFKMYGYVEQSMDPETWSYSYNFTPSTTLPLPSPFSPYVPSGHDSLFDLDTLDSSNGIYRIRWKVNTINWNHDNHDSSFIPLDEMLSVQLCDSSGSVKAVIEVYGVDLTGVTDTGGFFYNSWYFGDMNIKNATSVTNMEGFNRGFDEIKYYLPSAGLPVDETYFIFPTDLSSCTNMTNAFSSVGFGDYAMQLYSGPIPDFRLGSGLVNVNYAFANQKNLSEGILAQYTRMASLSNISSHTGTFMNCGTNKSTTGAVQLSQIPSSWGGTGT